MPRAVIVMMGNLEIPFASPDLLYSHAATYSSVWLRAKKLDTNPRLQIATMCIWI